MNFIGHLPPETSYQVNVDLIILLLRQGSDWKLEKKLPNKPFWLLSLRLFFFCNRWSYDKKNKTNKSVGRGLTCVPTCKMQGWTGLSVTLDTHTHTAYIAARQVRFAVLVCGFTSALLLLYTFVQAETTAYKQYCSTSEVPPPNCCTFLRTLFFFGAFSFHAVILPVTHFQFDKLHGWLLFSHILVLYWNVDSEPRLITLSLQLLLFFFF